MQNLYNITICNNLKISPDIKILDHVCLLLQSIKFNF